MIWLGLALFGGIIVYASKSMASDGSSDESSSDPVNSTASVNSFNRFDSLFKEYGSIWGVDWKMLKAICLNESDLGREKTTKRGLEMPSDIEGSKSYDGLSWGIMQVTLRTARDLDPTATEQKLNNAEYSINLAARYLSILKKMFNAADPRFTEWVVKSYNQGPGNTRKEIAGTVKGYAQEYWERYKRNYQRVG